MTPPQVILPRWLAAALIAVSVPMLPAGARAETAGDAKSTSGEHARRAQAAYDVQDWPVAIKEYRSAYQVEQRPEFLWGLAQSLRMSGDCRSAILSYKAYRRADVTANQGTAAELMVTRCEAEIAKSDAEAAKAASATPSSSAPASSAPAPETAPIDAKPASPVVAAAPAPAPKKFYEDVLGDTLFIVGAAAAGVGGYFLLSGNSQVKDGNDAATYANHTEAIDDGKRKQMIGAVTLGASGVLLVGAVVRFVTFDPNPNHSVSVGLDGVTFSGRF